MKKRQKHYQDKISVLAEIHKAQRDIGKMMVEQERLDNEGKTFAVAGNQEQAKFNFEQAAKVRRSIGRIETGKLSRLKQTLSAVQTGDMFGQPSINLQ